MELREKCGFDMGAGLVVRPQSITKRLDHVIGGDADVDVPVLDELENGLQDADGRTVGGSLPFVNRRKP
jgi:hypothetical protein